MALEKNPFLILILGVMLFFSLALQGQDIEEKLSQFDTLAISDTLDAIPRQDSLYQPLDSTLLPSQSEIDSLQALQDSLTAPFYRQEIDSQFILFMDGGEQDKKNKFQQA